MSMAWMFASRTWLHCGGAFRVVLQDPFLFSGTIAQNIRLGIDWITEEELANAARTSTLRTSSRRFHGALTEPVRNADHAVNGPETADQLCAGTGDTVRES